MGYFAKAFSLLQTLNQCPIDRTEPARTRDFDYSFLVKIALIGRSGIGKSCLIQREKDDTFADFQMQTIGTDFHNLYFDQKVQSNNNTAFATELYKAQLWDTGGNPKFRFPVVSYYRSMHCFILCFKPSDRLSFDELKLDWYPLVCQRCPTACLLLVGLMCDLPNREVTRAEARAFAASIHCRYIETSARTGSGCGLALRFATWLAVEKVREQQQKDSPPVVAVQEPLPSVWDRITKAISSIFD